MFRTHRTGLYPGTYGRSLITVTSEETHVTVVGVQEHDTTLLLPVKGLEIRLQVVPSLL